MTNNSKNRREGFKVVVQDRWSLNSSGRYDDFDSTFKILNCNWLSLVEFDLMLAIW